jgi:NAD-dependent dihydropyrimidine dehydrogenase PreA subunit
MSVRKIVKIDEAKCNGCGECIVNCPEGALQIIDGKARLVKESYCDGLGACLGNCPLGAITIEEREADEFDEQEVQANMAKAAPLPCGCPGTLLKSLAPAPACDCKNAEAVPSQLSHWPVQLALVPPTAPFLKNAEVLLAADCVPFAFADFHRRFLSGNRPVLVACPKLDAREPYVSKLKEIFRTAGMKSLTIVHMEVPCCGGLNALVQTALAESGATLAVKEITIGISGQILSERQW